MKLVWISQLPYGHWLVQAKDKGAPPKRTNENMAQKKKTEADSSSSYVELKNNKRSGKWPHKEATSHTAYFGIPKGMEKGNGRNLKEGTQKRFT